MNIVQTIIEYSENEKLHSVFVARILKEMFERKPGSLGELFLACSIINSENGDQHPLFEETVKMFDKLVPSLMEMQNSLISNMIKDGDGEVGVNGNGEMTFRFHEKEYLV